MFIHINRSIDTYNIHAIYHFPFTSFHMPYTDQVVQGNICARGILLKNELVAKRSTNLFIIFFLILASFIPLKPDIIKAQIITTISDIKDITIATTIVGGNIARAALIKSKTIAKASINIGSEVRWPV